MSKLSSCRWFIRYTKKNQNIYDTFCVTYRGIGHILSLKLLLTGVITLKYTFRLS